MRLRIYLKCMIILSFISGSLISATASHAALIQQFKPFSTSVGQTGFDLVTFTPFDTTLGNLETVNIGIQGNTNIFSPTSPNNHDGDPRTNPIPFNYTIGATLDVFSLAGFDFDFSSNAQFFLTGFNTGQGGTIIESRSFSIDIELDQISDNIGFDIPTTANVEVPPLQVVSTRSEFEQNLITSSTGLQFQMLNSWRVISQTGVGQISPGGNISGVMSLSYEYTPVSPVPVPAAAWLFGSALLGLLGFKQCGNRDRSI